ncbi:hypothetical protein [Microbacterium sp. GXF6406]
MKIHKKTLGLAAAAVLTLAVCLPTSAYASTADGENLVVGASSTQVITQPMTIDCSTFSEADRERAIKENLNLCGALGDPAGMATLGQTVSDCGVSSIYVDRNSGGRLRISYGMHSTVGAIVTRSVDVTWGPFDTGSNFDFGAVGNASYSNSLTRASIPSGAKAGGTLRGTVAIAGWTFACWVAADDPVHSLR